MLLRVHSSSCSCGHIGKTFKGLQADSSMESPLESARHQQISRRLGSRTTHGFLEAELFLKLIPVQDKIRQLSHLVDPTEVFESLFRFHPSRPRRVCWKVPVNSDREVVATRRTAVRVVWNILILVGRSSVCGHLSWRSRTRVTWKRRVCGGETAARGVAFI